MNEDESICHNVKNEKLKLASFEKHSLKKDYLKFKDFPKRIIADVSSLLVNEEG